MPHGSLDTLLFGDHVVSEDSRSGTDQGPEIVLSTTMWLSNFLGRKGKQTEQTDVYSFGASLLEVACGKKPIYHEDDGHVVVLVDHVREMRGNSQILSTQPCRHV